MTGPEQPRHRPRRAWRTRAPAILLSLGAHLVVLAAMFSARMDPPIFSPPPRPPIAVTLVDPPRPLPRAEPPPGPAAPSEAAPAAAVTAPAEPQKPVPIPPPVRPRPARRPPPPEVEPLPASPSPAPVVQTMASLSDAQLAGAARAGSGRSGGAGTGPGVPGGGGSGATAGECDMVGRIQDALRSDPEVRAAAAQAQRAVGSSSKTPLVWNGDWIQTPGEAGKGLAGVRQAIAIEVAFAPAACRAQAVRGMVVIAFTDAPGGPRLALGSGQWRWSDLVSRRR